jgi:hypothetical protein
MVFQKEFRLISNLSYDWIESLDIFHMICYFNLEKILVIEERKNEKQIFAIPKTVRK